MSFRSMPFRVQFATILFVGLSIYYIPIDHRNGLGPIHISLFAVAGIFLFWKAFKVTRALLIGVVYLLVQYISAIFHPESMRWSTYVYSCMLVFTFVCFYNLLYVYKVFSIDYFIKLAKWTMMLFFVCCIMQQICLLLGFRLVPILNLCQRLGRGIGCNSLSLEPSMFGRYMLVFYYAYIKCCEYKRGEGPFSLKELFNKEHRWVSVRFLWMMLTMGSGTAFVCLLMLSLYFVRFNNWFYVIPLLIGLYIALPYINNKNLRRATTAITLVTTLDTNAVVEEDKSAAFRLAPVINTINADYSDPDFWFGKGVDSGLRVYMFDRTLCDDYGFLFLLLSYFFSLACAYRLCSLAALFLFAGVAGGAGTNIQYAWTLMIVMSCVKYFYEECHES